MIALTGCDSKQKEQQKVSSNYPIVKFDFVCDERGLKYYLQDVGASKIALPYFQNTGESGMYKFSQSKCD